MPHLIKHDLVHGIWHFDKGLLYTLREAFMRPGHMAMDYIKGRRIKYYNVFYLILLVLGINAVVAHYFKLHYHISEEDTIKGMVVDKNTADISYYIAHYWKLLLFLIIPFFALGGFLTFRKLKLNFAEHAIIAGSLLLTGAMGYFFITVGMYTSRSFDSDIFNCLVWAVVGIVYLQPARVYYQAARTEYTIGPFILRVLQWYAYVVLMLYLVLLVIGAFTGKTHIRLS